MDGLTEALDSLSAATEATDALRSVLQAVNVSLPAFLAQLLSLGVLLGIGWYFSHQFRKAEQNLPRLVNAIVTLAAGIGVIAIAANWGDYLLNPRSSQVVGHIIPAEARGIRLELLDYQGNSLGADFSVDKHGAFTIDYSAPFADPPRAIRVIASHCQQLTIPLRRHHLIDSLLSIPLVCEGEG